MNARNPAHAAGFTAVEMMIVVLILGILAAIAAPNMMNMVRTQRVKTASFDLFASLNAARSEAIKRNLVVTLTPTNAGDWAQGWEIKDANDQVLRKQAGWYTPPDSATVSIVGPATVSFGGNGRATAVSRFTLSAYGIAETRCLNVDLSGRTVTC